MEPQTNRLGPIRQAKIAYYAGIDGNKGAGDKATTLFAKLHQQLPGDPLVTVYYGSLRLREAGQTWALWKKNSLSKEGIRLMDGAVTANPGNLEILFVRAATERELPGFFGRKQQSDADFRSLVKTAEQAAVSGQLEPRLAAASFYYYGLSCESAGRKQEAIDAWHTAIKIAPATPPARRSTDRLKNAGVK